ncbi:uncharacterized protein K460DRAFT_203491 [Cucurbitaria berberidis CBS 394.84]|uniref:Uncharacterized protein n=1 Tax=Cucurbitaria berberidis CBS 394.84 TaxID=1168544 RepID=A0A9P4G6V1_9PLEO|nr:uncharacterized protein K460DRAFT_203491 [Cucurbitaria berberidis CBS 394.84]KAF1840123.1 hypothetical protein K460DRAFT_203491 [Cucurbitaria berberidis CBS 394.84]
MDFECPSHNRIRSWLNSAHTSYLPITPPPDTERKSYLRPLKRKRAASLPMYAPSSSSHRNESPKRQRTRDIDIVEPGQSVSQVGSENALALNRTNTFCPPASRVSSSSPNRSSSPARETPVILRSAWPPVWTESLNGLHEAPPPHAEELGERLADGVDFHFIPHALQVRITTQRFIY